MSGLGWDYPPGVTDRDISGPEMPLCAECGEEFNPEDGEEICEDCHDELNKQI